MESTPWLQLCLSNNEMFRSHLLTEKKKLQQNRAVRSAKTMQFEGRKKGRQEKEREILYRGIMTDTNARFKHKQATTTTTTKHIFIKIVIIPFQTLFWPWDQTKTRKKEVFSFSYTTGLQAQEWPRYCLGTETHKGFFNPLWVSAGKQAYKNHTRPIIAQKENHWNRDTWYSFPPDGLEFGMAENATVWTGQKGYYMHLYARPANFFTKQKRPSFNWVRLKKTPT